MQARRHDIWRIGLAICLVVVPLLPFPTRAQVAYTASVAVFFGWVMWSGLNRGFFGPFSPRPSRVYRDREPITYWSYAIAFAVAGFATTMLAYGIWTERIVLPWWR
jgi:hypothetical protein